MGGLETTEEMSRNPECVLSIVCIHYPCMQRNAKSRVHYKHSLHTLSTYEEERPDLCDRSDTGQTLHSS